MKNFQGLKILTSIEDICRSDRMALVIYDMQVGIVQQIADGPRIVDGCHKLIAAARQAGIRVFYTRHISLPSKSAGVAQIRRSMIWQRKENPADTIASFLSSSSQAAIVSELKPQDTDVVIDKITMSAFESTYLNIALRDLGIQAFAIAGIALDVGIEPTVRHGLDLNLIPVLVPEFCGSRTPEAHQHSIKTLESTGEIISVTGQQLIESMVCL